MSIGSNLKKIRLNNGMSQTELAGKAKITSVYVSNIERDKKNPSAGILNRLAETLNVSIEEFFKEEDSVDYIDTLNDKEALELFQAIQKNDVLKKLVVKTKDLDPSNIRKILKIIDVMEE